MTGVLQRIEDDFGAKGVSIDTRTLKEGEAFLALRGLALDGHGYVQKALAAGAACAIVREDYEGEGALLRVPDTMLALEELARDARARAKAKVIGVTGSAGKTGTKEMLAAILSSAGTVHASRKSFNNHWGVPLTLANLPAEADFAVIEMGMNHAGELTALSALVRPHAAIVTTVEAAHIEHFASVEAIADAKAEIFSGMESGGIAVLNLDNSHYDRLRAAALKQGLSVLPFGEEEEAEARIEDLELHSDSSRVFAVVSGRKVRFRLAIPGRHIAMNALAALAAAAALGVDPVRAASALEKAEPVAGRGNRLSVDLVSGEPPLIVIDESYNANPASMAAALGVLEMAEPKGEGRRIAVLGDMLELGPEGPRLHAALANPLLKARADLVFCCGPQMEALYSLLPEQWQGAHAADSRLLSAFVAAAVRPGDVVLVKGSAGSRMAYIVEALASLGPNRERKNAL